MIATTSAPIDEIIVTAQNVQDVSITITAFTCDLMKVRTITNVSEAE